ncbi:putative leader peptide [Kineococcus rubinsiae]
MTEPPIPQGTVLTARRHIDLQRTDSAVCPR